MISNFGFNGFKVRGVSMVSMRGKNKLTLVNVNAPVVATTSWWLHFSAPVVA